MKKITSLLILLLMCLGSSVWAGPTDLPELTENEGSPVWYTLKNVRKNKYAGYGGDAADIVQTATTNPTSLFYFTGFSENGVATVKIHNAAANGNLCAETNSWTKTGRDWYIASKAANGLSISKTPNFDGNNSWNDFYNRGQIVGYFSATDGGSIWVLEKVTNVDSVANLAQLREDALAKLTAAQSLNLPVVYPNIDASIQKVTDAKTSGTVAELVESWKIINAELVSLHNAIDGKNFRFRSFGRDDVLGHEMAFNLSGLVGATNAGDAGIWTLKSQHDGSFLMYNFVFNRYVKPQTTQSVQFQGTEVQSEAGVCKFVTQGENIVNLKCNDNTIHIDSNLACVQWNHSDTEPASQFTITTEAPIVIDQETYSAANHVVEKLPYSLQDVFGLAKNGSDFVSNYMETREGSYDNLVDNNYETHFHSSYDPADIAEDIPAHDLTVSLSAPTSSIRFYMKKRMQNDNNRPIEVLVSASENGTDFTEVETVTTTMASTIDFMSEPIQLGMAATKVRFTVLKTNTGTKFFTLSELYVLPENETVNEMADAFNNFVRSSIVQPECSQAAELLMEIYDKFATRGTAYEELEAAKALTVDNPANFGQYSISSWNEAKAAVDAAQSAQEIVAAMKTFKHSVTAPVYLINSGWDDGYCKNSSAYWDGSTWKWKTINESDCSSWFKAVGKTTSDIVVGEKYNFVNWVSNTTIYKDQPAVVENVVDWEGVYQIRVVPNDDYGYLHAQDTGKLLVKWLSPRVDADQASAWRLVYIGNSYEMSVTATEAAIAALNDTYTKYTAENVFGDGLNQARKTEQMKVALEQASLLLNAPMGQVSVEQLQNAKAAIENAYVINQPAAKSFYRLCCVEGGRYLQSTQNEDHSRQQLTGDKGDAASFLYISDVLISYTEGRACGDRNLAGVGVPQRAEFSKAHNGNLGQYNIKLGDKFIFGAGETLDSGTAPDLRNGYNWWLEPVDSIHVSVSEALYATLYTPCALQVPAKVKAYTASLGANSQTLVLTEVPNGLIPENTAVILIAEEAGLYNFVVSHENPSSINNILKGYFNDGAVPSCGVKTLQKLDGVVGMYNFTGAHVHGFKAFLLNSDIPAGVNGLRFSFGEATGIEGVAGEQQNEVYYDLNGRRVLYPAHGVFVTGNGQKVYIK